VTSRTRRAAIGVGVLVLTLGLLGCTSIPDRRYAINTIKVVGNSELDDSEIKEKIASRETPRFLSLFQGLIYDYELFDRYVLERDLQRIERYYRARGFYWPRVRAGRVSRSGDRQVNVEIVVEEGDPVNVARVDVHGLSQVDPEIATAARKQTTSALGPGDRFEEESFEQAAKALERSFADNGHAHVQVRRSADVDVSRQQAAVGYWVDPGPVVHLGEVKIEGLGKIPEHQVRASLGLEPGDRYSLSDMESAERAVLDLGVFSSVSVRPRIEEGTGVDKPKPVVVPVDVVVQTSKFRSLHLGGGVQVDSQKTDVHLVGGWEHRNFLGGLRNLVIEVVPGAVIYPTRIPEFETPERLLPQARLRVEFRQPGFLEALMTGVTRLQSSIYPVLLSSERDPDLPILGYRDLRASAGVERSLFWKLHGALTHNVQINDPFTYVGTLDPDLDMALVSYPELFLRLDARDDRLEPTKGVYASTSLQVAGVGGDARDIKVQPEGRAYVPLGRKVVLAFRATAGFLFPENYGDTVASNAFTGTPGTSRSEWVRDVQLMFLRGFFGGGPGSNRGYALREIGPHGTVPFYNPGQSSEELSGNCDPATAEDPEDLPGNCDLPLGGFSLWEASAELRFPLTGPLRGAVFADLADVSPYKFSLRWRPHFSPGVGIRLGTPIGPIRFDIGYRVPGLQAPDSADEFEPDTLLGLPIAASFGIGEPF
jgi:outer membrane protein insertion porin family/translocation and assembly module TamA